MEMRSQVPVRVARRGSQPGRRDQYRRRDPHRAGASARTSISWTRRGGSRPWRRCPARAPGGDAGRAVAARLAHRRPGRRTRSSTSRPTTCRSASACSNSSGRADPSSRCGSCSTSSTATVMSLPQNCFRGWRFRRAGTTPESPAVPTTLAELAAPDRRCPTARFGDTDARFNESGTRGRWIPTSVAAKRLRPLLRRPDDHPEPQPAPARQGAVLRGEDGAERSGHLRRPARRRAGARAARGRHAPSTVCTRSATPRPMRSARPIPARARRSRRDWCTATSPPETRPGADDPRHSGSSASAFFSISYQYSGCRPRDLDACRRRPTCGKVASASSRSLIIFSASSRSLA